jgi:prepilin peptidase CpaA
MTPLSPVSLYAIGFFLTFCVMSDLATRRIPNALTLSGMGAGLLLGGISAGPAGLAASAGGMLLAIALLIMPFALGGIGGGDVKMMAAVGSLTGPRALLACLLVGMILGGLVAVGVLWRRGRLTEKLHAVGAMMRSALLMRSLVPLRAPAQSENTVTLPYSVPLGLGTALALSFAYTLGA